MASVIYADGTKDVTVAAGDKIAVFSNSKVNIYQQVGYPNLPSTWNLLYATSDGETYTSSAFASGATIRIDAGPAICYYETNSAPVIAEPQTDIAAADATFSIAGLQAAQGGYVAVTGGLSTGGNNIGGAVRQTGGQGNGTGAGGAASMVGGASGTGATGNGGAAYVTGGAAASTNGNGGAAILAGGAKAGSGIDGMIIERSVKLVKQGAPTAKTTSATLTAAEVQAGIITVNQGAAGASAQQLPTASAMDTAFPDAAAGDAFEFSVINISTVAAEDASLTTNTGWTLVGSMVVESNDSDRAASSGRFRARKTGAAAWTLYRLA